jgi:hypothetical protein
VGLKYFSIVVRFAIPEEVVMMVSRNCKHGAHRTILLREVRHDLELHVDLKYLS